MDNLPQIFSSNTAWYMLCIVSLFGGLLSSISPCSLAMLPLIIGYVGGYSNATPFVTFIQLCFFIFGTSVVFTIIGVACALTGSVFSSMMGAYFTLLMSSLLMVMGLKLLGLLDFEIPTIIKAMPVNKTNSVFVYPVLLGITFALAGTPCSTPILAGIMTFAAMGKNLWLAVIMLFLFSIGQWLILIIAGLFTSGVKNMRLFAKYTEHILKFSGILLILVSLFLFWKIFAPLI